MNDNKVMNMAADNIRILAASMVEKAKSGHPGGAMGGADFINTLYSEFLVYDPENPAWEGRDRFFLDPGHMAPMLYSQLCLIGKYTLEDLQNLRQWGSVTPGHPEREIERGIENTSGPLGQGHCFAVGAAIAAKFLKARLGNVMNQTIYAYISDGGVQEEISQGAGRIAGNLGLDNLIMFYDANDIQLSTKTEVVTCEDTAKKYEAWGWYVQKIDGNNVDQIREAIKKAQAEKERPSLIGAPLGGDAYINTMKNLGADPENPFQIFPEVKELYAKRAEELKKICAERYAEKAEWAKGHPVQAKQLEEWFSGKAPKIDWSKVEQKAGSATRSASAAVLGQLAEQVPNMICASADLSNSDNTNGFLKKTKDLVRGDFSGAFFEAGVAELTMACCCIGMALHGGVIPACGTFFVFSDYMKPAVRMAALMELPVKFIWTHDAFRVGEDGPTHEPVEQEAQIRLMEKLKNHHGKNSVLVVRPADAEETTVCWRMAMENIDTPTALIFSRQNIEMLPEGNDYSQATKGAYVVAGSDENYDVILLASGSEVSTLEAGAKLLAADGIKTRVVSVPSEGLFRSQSKEEEVRSDRWSACEPRRSGWCRRYRMGSRELRFLCSLQGARREARLHWPECLRTGKETACIIWK